MSQLCAHGNTRYNCLECDQLRNDAAREKLNDYARKCGRWGGQLYTVRQVGGTQGGLARWQIIGPDGRKVHKPATQGVTYDRLDVIAGALVSMAGAMAK